VERNSCRLSGEAVPRFRTIRLKTRQNNQPAQSRLAAGAAVELQTPLYYRRELRSTALR
jgi:hypothetical protein